MQAENGATRPFWIDDVTLPQFPRLEEELATDVCIVGGGIAGMSVAYLMAESGRSVTLIEDGEIGGGETCRSTAHLSSAIDDTFIALQNRFGKDGARLAAESHMAAIDKIEAIIRKEQIDCDFQRLNGYTFNPAHEENIDQDKELKAAQECGISDVTKLQSVPFPGAGTGIALCYGRQAVFHPLKYLAGIAASLASRGTNFFTHTRAIKIEQSGNYVIHTQHAKITAQCLVIATNDPIVKCNIPKRNVAYRSYAIGIRCSRNALPMALYWDTGIPYYHMRVCRLNDAEDLVIAGGEDHRTGSEGSLEENAARFSRIEAWARQYVPELGRVMYKWSGQVMEPVDYLAFIGRLQKGRDLFVVTGGSGHGLTHGTIAGMLIADLANRRENAWATIYDPLRGKGNYGTLVKYRLGNFAKWFSGLLPGNIGTAQLVNGQGAIIRQGLHRRAAYKDEHGGVHMFAATCPYSRRLLTWNSLEHTWDCPVYGSRYDGRDGHVINGPSNTPMQRIG